MTLKDFKKLVSFLLLTWEKSDEETKEKIENEVREIVTEEAKK